MLDIELIRKEPDVVRKALQDRQLDSDAVDIVLDLDQQRRMLIQKVESLKAERNLVSKEIGRTKDPDDRQSKIEAMRLVGDSIQELDERLRSVNTELEGVMAFLPNIPDKRTPYGVDEDENVVIKEMGEIPEFDFETKAHWDLGPELGITYPACCRVPTCPVQ